MSADIPQDPSTRVPRVRERLQLLIVVLLGLVSVTTAYTSFQASMYGGLQSAAYTQGGAVQTEAESLYLEASGRYLQDAQLLTRMTELSIDMESVDPIVAASASAKFDSLVFTAFSPELQAAIDWSVDVNAANPDDYVSPQASDEYRAALFGSWAATDDRSAELFADGDRAGALGDRLTLNTVLLAVALFLLGIAAVLRNRAAQWVLVGVGMAIYVVAVALTAAVPIVGL
jgi:hypothetical protein